VGLYFYSPIFYSHLARGYPHPCIATHLAYLCWTCSPHCHSDCLDARGRWRHGLGWVWPQQQQQPRRDWPSLTSHCCPLWPRASPPPGQTASGCPRCEYSLAVSPLEWGPGGRQGCPVFVAETHHSNR
jgi:hypothetical protein